ncbi:hypothetical protein CHS0354_029062 [Potamilus streckersoni]|uniref:Uncharacterized protein n=1 Tax=Potamilus streckersoni TaxID=2493646 RepID=A0AAE0SRZ7_9BIVA|nr:hypothetical protein CHS0354_029062 [Potamilus streckersoni]
MLSLIQLHAPLLLSLIQLHAHLMLSLIQLLIFYIVFFIKMIHLLNEDLCLRMKKTFLVFSSSYEQFSIEKSKVLVNKLKEKSAAKKKKKTRTGKLELVQET